VPAQAFEVQRPRAQPVRGGVTHLVVAPTDGGGWSFKGQGDFGGLLHRRVQAAPPDTPLYHL
jgi:hypothetical protein